MSEPQRKKLDAQQLISGALGMVAHWRIMVIILALGLLSGIVYYCYATPTYLSRCLVDLKVFSTPVGTETVAQDVETPAHLLRRGLITELTSRHIGLRAAKSLRLVRDNDSYENVIEDHIPKLQVELLDVNHIQITVYAYEPRVVREYAQALVDAYRDNQKELREKYRKQASDRYSLEMEEIKRRIAQETRDRTDFEKKSNSAMAFIELNKLTQVPGELILARDRLTRMSDMRKNLKAAQEPDQIIEQLSLLSTFEKDSPVGVGTVVRKEEEKERGPLESESANTTKVVVQPAMVEPAETWKDVEKEYRELLVEIDQASLKFGPQNPDMLKLTTRRDDLVRSLTAELQMRQQRFDVDEQRTREKLAELEQKLPEYHEVTEKYEQFRKEFTLMEKGQSIWDKAFANLSAKIAAIDFDLDKDRVELTYAGFVTLRDVDPVSPNKFKLLIVALTVGVGGALAASWLLRFLNTTTSRLVDLEQETGLKGLGLVPHTPAKIREDVFRAPVIGAKVPNYLLECFRLIRAQICLHKGKRSVNQVIAITSARPSEGKTSLACNLAWAFYSMGERTLLVDCDLRRGRVHVMTGMPNDQGMSRLMAGQISLDAVQLATRDPRLRVAPRGPIITGATEMLVQPYFEQILEVWRGQYDRIILDCPPVLGLSETCALAHLADGLALVVRAEVTPRRDVLAALDLLDKAGASVVGFVLNALDLKKVANSYQYYYYSPDYSEALAADRGEEDADQPDADDDEPQVPRGRTMSSARRK